MRKLLVSISLLFVLLLSGCEVSESDVNKAADIINKVVDTASDSDSASESDSFEIPDYNGHASEEINNNKPYDDLLDYADEADDFESYSELDSLGRCGVCVAKVGKETMPTEKRGQIGSIKPSGWQTIKYDFISGKYLYNRCHLIGYQLTGENANERNLITGTRELNIKGMLGKENDVAEYIKVTGNHVLYRVTPMYKNDEDLVADGVLMEGYSVEDNGDGINYCIYAFNRQPGVKINYKDGSSTEK